MTMKTKTIFATLFCALTFVMNTQAQQVPQPKTAAEVPRPVPGQTMTEEYARVVGQFAYMWAWPMMNMHNRRDAFDKVTEPVIVTSESALHALLDGTLTPTRATELGVLIVVQPT
jgi:hypothetical protein